MCRAAKQRNSVHRSPSTHHVTFFDIHFWHFCKRAACIRHVSRHTSLVARHSSLVTRHSSHVTRHTSHFMRHTSLVTRYTTLRRITPPQRHLVPMGLCDLQQHHQWLQQQQCKSAVSCAQAVLVMDWIAGEFMAGLGHGVGVMCEYNCDCDCDDGDGDGHGDGWW